MLPFGELNAPPHQTWPEQRPLNGSWMLPSFPLAEATSLEHSQLEHYCRQSAKLIMAFIVLFRVSSI
jgi:hypothetical protein